jgi:hypothetical protein
MSVGQGQRPCAGMSRFFDMVTDGEAIQRVAWAHADPTQQERVPRYAPPQQLGDHPAGRTLLGGQAQLVAEVTDAWMQAAATSPEHLQFMRDLGIHWLMRVPLIARERPIGVLTFGLAGSGRRDTPADLVLAEVHCGLSHVAPVARKMHSVRWQDV